MITVRVFGEQNGISRRAIAEIPYPLLNVALPRRIGTQVAECGCVIEAVRCVKTEERRRMRQHLNLMRNLVIAAVGINNAQGYGIGSIGSIKM